MIVRMVDAGHVFVTVADRCRLLVRTALVCWRRESCMSPAVFAGCTGELPVVGRFAARLVSSGQQKVHLYACLRHFDSRSGMVQGLAAGVPFDLQGDLVQGLLCAY